MEIKITKILNKIKEEKIVVIPDLKSLKDISLISIDQDIAYSVLIEDSSRKHYYINNLKLKGTDEPVEYDVDEKTIYYGPFIIEKNVDFNNLCIFLDFDTILFEIQSF